MKLYAKPGSFRAQKIIIAAQYADKKLEIITDAKPASIKGKSPISKLPLLETAEGCIAESNAIGRFLVDSDSSLKAKTALENAQVDSWVDFCCNEIEVPSAVWVYPIVGWLGFHAEATEKAKKDLKAAIMVLEAHLKSRTFLVGESLTYADVALSCALLLPFKLVLDEKTRKPFPCVTRWFLTCVNQKKFKEVVGEVTLCGKKALAAKAAGAPAPAKAAGKKSKKEKKPEAKKPAPAAAPAAAPAPKKKAKNPLDELPKSKFVVDAWKKQYSNAPGGDCYKVMPWLWENFDKEGWSFFHGSYKYNKELEVAFMTSNLAGGFVQRCDAVRKYSFGVIQILGKDGGPMEIRITWIMRGQSIDPLIEANPDAEHYEWKKVENLDDEKEKSYIADMFCAWETVDGLPILDAKVFK
mmetsp:Transcript_10723/g.12945  ORF Transcript_10723/g.12945 Transcript_10723/m.12945 type:complete len:411 (+) Transcript_10723:119-1351(+)|eukprot:CAMPEP_0184005894 /NCGR_PEP_ID=MMETSP0954-20121128/338_1 /TAXON_ID=627963 /ORGANISM="Aplanochytrium sp, Strain PBS07" /LENGTH=410 /DNA_ID=CAMNT_0026284277 /DNA_START=98 /DNA_END=1330 /DNA_ORIENTATION=+